MLKRYSIRELAGIEDQDISYLDKIDEIYSCLLDLHKDSNIKYLEGNPDEVMIKSVLFNSFAGISRIRERLKWNMKHKIEYYHEKVLNTKKGIEEDESNNNNNGKKETTS